MNAPISGDVHEIVDAPGIVPEVIPGPSKPLPDLLTEASIRHFGLPVFPLWSVIENKDGTGYVCRWSVASVGTRRRQASNRSNSRRMVTERDDDGPPSGNGSATIRTSNIGVATGSSS